MFLVKELAHGVLCKIVNTRTGSQVETELGGCGYQ